MTKTLIGLLLAAGIVYAAGLPAEIPPRRDIQGGTETDPLLYPFMVQVRHSGVADCSGTLIRDDWVLTAAHCVDGASVTEYENIGSCISAVQVYHRGTSRFACEIAVHDSYDPFDPVDTYVYDVALVRIQPFTSRTVRPVALAESTDSELAVTGVTATAAGFGPDVYTPILRTASWDIADCPDSLPASMVCAQASPQVIAERGDSGSPLLVERDDAWVQVGSLVATSTSASVVAYTRLYTLAEWVRSVVGDTTPAAPADPETPSGACPVSEVPPIVLDFSDGRWTVRFETLP